MSVRVLRIAVVLALSALLVGCGAQASSGNLGALLGEGWRAYAMGNFDAAQARFARVLQDKQVNEDQTYSAVLGIAVSAQYQPTPDLAKALEYYKRLGGLKVESAGPQSMLGIGTVDIAQGRTEEGQLELTNLAQQFTDREEANEAVVQLANSLFRPTPDEKAVGGYRMASPAFIQRGMDLLQRRLRAYPDNPLAAVMHMMLANQYVEREAYKDAVAELQAALEFGIESSNTRGNVTWQIARIADEKLHDYALAEKYYADYAANYERSQLYYRALLSKERMQKLLAEKPKE